MLCARDVATSFDRYMAATWRGDDRFADVFAAWLVQYWDSTASQPDGHPDGVHSALGGVGRGIDWHEEDDVVIGLIVGWTGVGCYRIPRTATLPVPAEPLAAHHFTSSPARRHPALRPRRLSAPPWSARRYRPRGD